MYTIVLNCTVCHVSVTSRRSWLLHLVQEEHQRRAQVDIKSWKQAEKRCAVVVTTSFDIMKTPGAGGGLAVLERLSTEDGFVVANLILMPGKPGTAVIQFESKWKVMQILEKTGDDIPITIMNVQHLLRLKRAEDCSDLEWTGLLQGMPSEDPNGDGEEAGGPNPNKQ